MSKFFVGQRVRWVRHPGPIKGPRHPESDYLFLGMQCTVVGTESNPNAGFRVLGDRNISVLPDAITTCGMAPDWCFDPILPSGHIASDRSYSELMEEFKEGVQA